MNIDQLLLQSLQLLGLGMGAVFIILILLIAVITIVSKLVPVEGTAPSRANAAAVNTYHIAAISAALHQHRKNVKS